MCISELVLTGAADEWGRLHRRHLGRGKREGRYFGVKLTATSRATGFVGMGAESLIRDHDNTPHAQASRCMCVCVCVCIHSCIQASSL